jgi:hypothetical protein
MQFKGEFSFVNKNAENIASSDHRPAVAWHVMHRYEPYKRRRRDKVKPAEAEGQGLSSGATTSPSSSEDQRPQPTLQASPAWIQGLVDFAHVELIPAISSDPAQYGGLLLSWHNLSRDSTPDYHDKAYLALLATISAHDDTLLCTARQLHTEALSELSTVPDVGARLYVAVMSLFLVQSILGQSDTARNLLKVLKSLIEPNGGIESLDVPLRLDVLSCDTFFAIRHQTRPLFSTKTWSAGKLAEPYRQRLGTKFDLADLRAFSAILDIVASLYELFDIRTSTSDAKDDLQQWCGLRRLECLSRLADHQVNLTLYPHRYSSGQVELAISAAALLLTVLIEGSPEPVQLGQTLLLRLRNSVAQLQPHHFASYPNLLRSIIDLGALAEHVLPVDQFWFQMHADVSSQSRYSMGVFDYPPLKREVEKGPEFRMFDTYPGLLLYSDISWRVNEKSK